MGQVAATVQERFEKLEYVLHMGPEKFEDYDYAWEAQVEADAMLETLAETSEYREPELYANLFEDIVTVLEDLESRIA